jgi:hypothetical protein
MAQAEILPAVLSASKERGIICLLCLVGAVHACIFSAALPFFSIVDEPAHFDLVVRYSHGDIPRLIDPVCNEAIPYIAIYGTPEIFWPLSAFPNGQIRPPPWDQPVDLVKTNLLTSEVHWSESKNHEAAQPPLYYLLTGAWWRAGQACGLHDGFLLYTVRFLNTIFIAAFVWLGYAAARLIFPDRMFMRLGVPALLALLPQSDFYSIQNDVLSPLCFGLVFYCVLCLWQADVPRAGIGAAAGIAFGATWLTKMSNLPLLALALAAVLFKTWRLRQADKLRAASRAFLAFFLCAGLPIAGWAARTRYFFGDFTGSAAKIQILGWTLKPFSQWWHHPIFTPHGLWKFASGLLATFWQGEFMWHHQPLALPMVNTLYTILSACFVGAALVSLLRRSNAVTKPQRQALWFGFGTFAAGVAFLGFLSIIYDFHNCFYPSREHPYFTSGRLIGGALIPFLLLFIFGMDRVLAPVKRAWARPLALIAMLLFMLISEIVTDWPVFSCEYNWYHM